MHEPLRINSEPFFRVRAMQEAREKFVDEAMYAVQAVGGDGEPGGPEATCSGERRRAALGRCSGYRTHLGSERERTETIGTNNAL